MTLPIADNVTVRPGRTGEAANLAALIAAAYFTLPIIGWLAPRMDHRQGILRGYYRLHVAHALTHGHVDVIDGVRGPIAVAGWLPANAPATPPGYAGQVATLAGESLERFRAFDAKLDGVRAPGHRRLAFVAVLPHEQRHGLGNALLANHITYLDERGIPSCLETLSPMPVPYFERCGFTAHGNEVTITASEDMVLTPMRRSPQRSDSSAGAP